MHIHEHIHTLAEAMMMTFYSNTGHRREAAYASLVGRAPDTWRGHESRPPLRHQLLSITMVCRARDSAGFQFVCSDTIMKYFEFYPKTGAEFALLTLLSKEI